MTSMVERVAKQLHETLSSQDIFGYLGANFDLHAVARATIEAMREPTEAMKVAFDKDVDDWFDHQIHDDHHLYKCMIDAALKETPNAHDR